MKKIIFNIVLLFAVSNTYSFHAFTEKKVSIQVDKWEVVDIRFSTNKTEAPFETLFYARFTNPSGEQIKIPGFYNGDNQYIIRFSGNISGNWTYTTYSDLKEINNLKGSVLVSNTPYKKSRGAITIDKINPQKFSYEDGTPYFLVAYEFDWLFALDYGEKNQKNTNQILDKLEENNYNQVVFNAYAYDIRWEKDKTTKPEHDFSKPKFFPFLGTNKIPDYSSLNIDFFKHLDNVIANLNNRNIVAHLMIYVWNKEVNWPKMYSFEDNRYFDYIIKRYQAYPNIIWDISKEALAYGRCDEKYVKERISRLKNLDVYNRLLTVHDYGFCKKNSDLVDFISIQNWSTELYNVMLRCKNNFPNKPIFNIEHGGYEKSPYKVFIGNFDNPKTCLRRNYICAFAGTYSTHYWQANSWSTVITDIDTLDEEDKPKLHYYKYFNEFFSAHNFNELSVSNAAMSWNVSNKKGKYIVFHPSENNSITIHIKKPNSGKVSITWFNIYTGTYSKTIQLKWKQWLWATAPTPNQDWIAIIE